MEGNRIAVNDSIDLKDKKMFRNALVCDVELIDGRQTQVTIIFNSLELHFESINVGLIKTLEVCGDVKRSKSKIYNLVDGKLKSFADFHEHVYHTTPE